MTEPNRWARELMPAAGIDLDAFDAALAEAREQAEDAARYAAGPGSKSLSTPLDAIVDNSLVRLNAAEAAADALCTLLLAGAVVPDAADYLAAKNAADTWRAVR